MIKQIDIIRYKKFKDISFNFEAGINAISGENGTCKSSLLYLIGNSFQEVKTTYDWINENFVGLFRYFAKNFDKYILKKFFDAFDYVIRFISWIMSVLQNGNLKTYAMYVLIITSCSVVILGIITILLRGSI